MLVEVPWSAYVLLGKFLGTMVVLGTVQIGLLVALSRWTDIGEKRGFGVSLAVVLLGWQFVIWPLTRDWYAVGSVPVGAFGRALGVAFFVLVAILVALLAMEYVADAVRLTRSE